MSNVDDFLEHYGVPGMKWGLRRSEYKALSREDRSQYRKKTRKERIQTNREAQSKSTALTYETAKSRGDRVLIKTSRPGDVVPTIMTGKEFAKFVENKGVFDARLTHIAAFPDSEEGKKAKAVVQSKLDEIWEPTAERYVKKES